MVRPRYQIDLRHDGLGKLRRISGPERSVVEERARLQLKTWNQEWDKVTARDNAAKSKQVNRELAAQKNQEAHDALAAVEGVLAHTLTVDDRIDWKALRSSDQFKEPPPERLKSVNTPTEPQPTDSQYQPQFSWLDRLFSSRQQRRLDACQREFEKAHGAWLARATEIAKQNAEATASFEQAMKKWEDQRDTFLALQRQKNEAVDRQQAAYEAKNPEAIAEYCDLVLSASAYPGWMPGEFDFQYLAETRTMVVELQLPTPEHIPQIKEVRYVQSKDAIEEKPIPEAQLHTMYDSLLYQISLRTIHELFEADTIDALDSVAFNGWVRSLDKAKGKEVTACIMSLHVRKAEFNDINLAQVDPKACFRSLKGVGSSQLHGLMAIAPILTIDRSDRRFIPARPGMEETATGTNLAAMDWEEFEHLIREVFEKEFSRSGGEVKVTRASRDGGVDAVAFDPDPIRGGKLVIQAKRYTNTVGVSAVRDLYGTLLNEGATKGILVTTSDYGPDAYEFAKGKPITLLNGSNLLSLLEKHGHRARIDLDEAKKELKEEQA